MTTSVNLEHVSTVLQQEHFFIHRHNYIMDGRLPYVYIFCHLMTNHRVCYTEKVSEL